MVFRGVMPIFFFNKTFNNFQCVQLNHGRWEATTTGLVLGDFFFHLSTVSPSNLLQHLGLFRGKAPYNRLRFSTPKKKKKISRSTYFYVSVLRPKAVKAVSYPYAQIISPRMSFNFLGINSVFCSNAVVTRESISSLTTLTHLNESILLDSFFFFPRQVGDARWGVSKLSNLLHNHPNKRVSSGIVPKGVMLQKKHTTLSMSNKTVSSCLQSKTSIYHTVFNATCLQRKGITKKIKFVFNKVLKRAYYLRSYTRRIGLSITKGSIFISSSRHRIKHNKFTNFYNTDLIRNRFKQLTTVFRRSRPRSITSRFSRLNANHLQSTSNLQRLPIDYNYYKQNSTTIIPNNPVDSSISGSSLSTSYLRSVLSDPKGLRKTKLVPYVRYKPGFFSY